MGLNKGPFVVADTVSVNAYGGAGTIELPVNVTTDVAKVDVCVTQPQKTQVSLDSMAQIAVGAASGPDVPIVFEVTYELLHNGDVIATINDEMDYVSSGGIGRHTNFPNFPVIDNNPSAGINTYELRCTRVADGTNILFILVASRSLRATVFTL